MGGVGVNEYSISVHRYQHYARKFVRLCTGVGGASDGVRVTCQIL